MPPEDPDDPTRALSGRGQAVLDLLDKAIGSQAPVAQRNIARLRCRRARLSPRWS